MGKKTRHEKKVKEEKKTEKITHKGDESGH